MLGINTADSQLHCGLHRIGFKLLFKNANWNSERICNTTFSNQYNRKRVTSSPALRFEALMLKPLAFKLTAFVILLNCKRHRSYFVPP